MLRIKAYPSIHREGDLLAANEVVSERRVARIMKENRVYPLFPKRRKPTTTDSNHKLKPSIAPSHTYRVCAAGNGQAICREEPNLLEQKFHSQTPNTVWLANITSMTPPLGIMLRITLPGKGRRLALFGWHQRHGHAGGRSSAGRWRITCAPSSAATLWRWLWAAEAPFQGWFVIPAEAASALVGTIAS